MPTTPERGIPTAVKGAIAAGVLAVAGLGTAAGLGAFNRGETGPSVPPSPAAASASPTPRETVSPTIAVKTPEPTPSLKPVASLFEGEHAAVSAQAITDQINALTPEDLAVISNALKGANIKQIFNVCLVGTPDIPGNQTPYKEAGCAGTIRAAYYAYRESGREKFYKLAQDVYSYATSPDAKLRGDATGKFIQTDLQRP